MKRKRCVQCTICGKENRATHPTVPQGKRYKQIGCNHCLWDPWRHPDNDFLSHFIKGEKGNKAIKVPEFHSLNLGGVPREVLEANRENLEKALKEELHEVDGWWFGDLDERENACRRLAKLLRPLCNAYSKAAES